MTVVAVDLDRAVLADLIEFARIELASGDLEPWAEMIGWLGRTGHFDDEQALWLTKAYNAYDDFGSAWAVVRRWPTPGAWARAADGHEAADYPCTQERRNLRGGKVLRHLDAYAARTTDTQRRWLTAPLLGADPHADYRRLSAHLRAVWGVGRQTAFEWAEFLGKANGFPVAAGDGDLWDSSGPRRSLEALHRVPRAPDARWLDDRATEIRAALAEAGVPLSWEDFETVICDFHVMRSGRYYPGRHLAALRDEIRGAGDADVALLEAAWAAVVPPDWQDIPPGINPAHLTTYRDTGIIRSHP